MPEFKGILSEKPHVVFRNKDGEFLANEEVELDVSNCRLERWWVHQDQEWVNEDQDHGAVKLRGVAKDIIVDKALVRKKRKEPDGTVGFMEAMTAARAGKRVQPKGDLGGEWLMWYHGVLVAASAYAKQRVTAELLDARWEIEPEPKTYTFLEAVEMMKAGKKMRPSLSYGSARYVTTDHFGVIMSDHGDPLKPYCKYFLEPWVEFSG